MLGRLLRRFRELAIIVAATLSILVVLEAAVRHFWPQTGRVTYIKGENLCVGDSELPRLMSPNTHTIHSTPEFSCEYIVNDQGLRVRDMTTVVGNKRPGVKRLLFVGDSFTFGAGNSFDDTFPAVFRKEFLKKGCKVEIVNAGISGFDTRSEVIYLRRILGGFNPDVVVLSFVANDLAGNEPGRGATVHDATESKAYALLWRLRQAIFSLQILQALKLLIPIDRITVWHHNLLPDEYLRVPPSKLFKRKARIAKELLEEALNLCRDKGAELVVLSIPMKFQVMAVARKVQTDRFDPHLVDDVLSKWAATKSVLWISTLDRLAEESQGGKSVPYFTNDNHLNKEGNRIVGQVLARDFLEAGLIGCGTSPAGVK